jgi:hypothetical protein
MFRQILATIEVITVLIEKMNIILLYCRLKLVVVMQTNNELMESEQPLKIFSSPINNDSELKNFK